MSLRPTDMQVMLTRVHEASRTQQVNNQQQQNNEQQQFAVQLQKQKEHEQQQVQNSPKSEKSRVEADARKGGQPGGHGKQRESRAGTQEQNKEEKPAKDLKLGKHIDIKV